jgi:hypothetical protein
MLRSGNAIYRIHLRSSSGGGRVLFEDDSVWATIAIINPPLQLAVKCVIDGSVGVGLCNLISMLLFDLKQNLPSFTRSQKDLKWVLSKWAEIAKRLDYLELA